MNERFPSAVPDIPVTNLARAAAYYERCLGFHWDWGVEGIGQVSRGSCRIFLTDESFRDGEVKVTPVVVWLNLDSKADVDAMHAAWSERGTQIVAPPEWYWCEAVQHWFVVDFRGDTVTNVQVDG